MFTTDFREHRRHNRAVAQIGFTVPSPGHWSQQNKTPFIPTFALFGLAFLQLRILSCQSARSFRLVIICLFLAVTQANLLVADDARSTANVVAGEFLLASAEGVSVFNRDGEMKFGHFVTSTKDGKPGQVEWDDMVYDACRLPSGNYLYSSHRYVRELTPGGKVLWDFQLKAPSELKTCVALPNGDVMTVDAERMDVVQLTDQGRREATRIHVPTIAEASIHNRYNLLRPTAAGTFLIALRHEKAFVEFDQTGKELFRYSVPGLPVVAERLSNGNTLMSWLGGMIEVAPDQQVVWEFKASDISEFPVLGPCGFHRFPNGNTLIANSDWHYKDADQNRVQVFEISRDKRVVWKLGVEAFLSKKPGSLEPRTGFVEHRIIGLQWLGRTAP